MPFSNVAAKPLSPVIELCDEQTKFKENPDEAEKKRPNTEFVREKTHEDLFSGDDSRGWLFRDLKICLMCLTKLLLRGFRTRALNMWEAFFQEEVDLHEEHTWAFEDVDAD